MPLPDGTLFLDRIRLDRFIGQGVLFDSYAARDESLGHKVFFKIERDDLTADNARLAFGHLSGWRNLARFEIAGLPRIYDFGEFNGLLFQVCEWIEGISLHDLALERHRTDQLPANFPEALLEGCLRNLVSIHEHGVLHLDISPHNILIEEPSLQIWLLDPGPSDAPLGRSVLTRAWAAPEVIHQRDGSKLTVGPWSDLYSLGMVVAAFCHNTRLNQPTIVESLVRPSIYDRPQSARVVLDSIEEAQSGSGPERRFLPRNRRPRVQIKYEVDRPVNEGAEDADFDSAKPELPLVFGVFSDFDTPRNSIAVARNWSDRTGISNVPIRSTSLAEPRDVDFIVMGPTLVAQERSFPLELWVGPSELAAELRDRASDRGRLVERGARARVSLSSNVTITAIVTLPGFEVANPTEQILWDGSISNAVFIVMVPEGKPAGRYAGMVKLVVEGVPVGAISFAIEVAGNHLAPDLPLTLVSNSLRRYRTAFASYSRRDTVEVFKRVQAIRAGEIDIFVDIANLRGGERWKDVLMREISARDVFYLFWSREAAGSEWVEREWREALDRRGLDFICPIPLEDPRLAKPPTELSDLHFNDWCLAIIRGEESFGASQGQ